MRHFLITLHDLDSSHRFTGERSVEEEDRLFSGQGFLPPIIFSFPVIHGSHFTFTHSSTGALLCVCHLSYIHLGICGCTSVRNAAGNTAQTTT